LSSLPMTVEPVEGYLKRRGLQRSAGLRAAIKFQG
jgi:hypothetical protein